jgi:heterodisulfide reductase subunit A
VERGAELGGQWRQIRYQADGSDPQAALAEWVARLQAEPGIGLHLGAELKGLSGQPGAYQAWIGGEGGQEAIEVGAVVVATGGGAARTGEYLYGRHPAVLTQRELEERLAGGTLPGAPLASASSAVVMIQCVGSREPGRPYCSRVCCTQAVKNALRLKALWPHRPVYILYREVRTFGFREDYYQAAREAGVVFVRYSVECLPSDALGTSGTGETSEPSGKPEVEAAGEGLRVRLVEPVTGLPLELEAGLLVLSVGIEPAAESGLAEMLGVTLDGDGFFQEEQAKMKPLDLGRGGLYVAGLAHSPRFLDETMVQGQAAALRAAAFLAPGVMSERPTAVWVNPRLCSYCGLCVTACPYGARVMDEAARVAQVDYALCQGCGVCAMVCPNKATLQKAFEHKQLLAALDMALV